jgi:DNA-binding MarR family transcriptional regulator
LANEFLVRSGLADQVGFVVRQASLAIWSDLVTTLAKVDLKPQTYAALLIIDTSPGCKQQDIADALGIARPNLVALIDGLVERGLADRGVNADDRRSYALTLTEKGRVLLKTGRATHRLHEKRIANALAESNEAELIAGARKLITRLNVNN